MRFDSQWTTTAHTIKAIIVASSLTQTRETREGHKCLMNGDITTINCIYPTGKRFFLFDARGCIAVIACEHENKSSAYNDDIITNGIILYTVISIIHNVIFAFAQYMQHVTIVRILIYNFYDCMQKEIYCKICLILDMSTFYSL